MDRPFTNSFAKSLYSSPRSSPAQNVQSNNGPSNKEPSTPVSQYPSPLPKTPISIDQTPTGKWSHPAVSQITRLQAQKAPNDRTVRYVLSNIAALFLLHKISPYIQGLSYWTLHHVDQYVDWTIYGLYILLAYNIVDNSRRFWWVNTFDDPTLNDRQRKLLNLPASPASAASQNAGTALTPPRYQKLFTPSPTSQSPLSAEGRRRASLNTYSPSNLAGGAQRNSVLGKSRNSPLQGRSPSTRSVSMLAGDSPSAKAPTYSSGNQASSLDFKSSSRWSFSQGPPGDPLSSSRSVY